ncbi:hypothetical protein [Kocuria sp. CPCC 205263]
MPAGELHERPVEQAAVLGPAAAQVVDRLREAHWPDGDGVMFGSRGTLGL